MARPGREQVISEVAAWDRADPSLVGWAFDTLSAAGLSPARAREWLLHKDRHHPIPVWSETFSTTLRYRAAQALRIAPDAATSEVEAYVSADPRDRSLADDLWLTMAAVERLVGDTDERRATLAEACRLIKIQLPKRGRVSFIVRNQHQRYNNRAILDMLADGREATLIDDLSTGTLDLTDESQFGMWIGGATEFDDR